MEDTDLQIETKHIREHFLIGLKMLSYVFGSVCMVQYVYHGSIVWSCAEPLGSMI